MKHRINISLDDVSPHPRSSTAVLQRCYEVLDRIPDAKFTLFVPTAYWRTIGPTATSQPLDIDRFPDFCGELRALPKDSFEIAFHGHHHGVPGSSNNDELQSISLEEARGIIGSMKEMVTKAGLVDEFKPILRPPAWRMCPEAFQACIEHGIGSFALSPDDYAMATYSGIERLVRHVMFNCNPPFKPLKLFEKTEIVYHAIETDKNFLDGRLTNELVMFLSGLQEEHEFVFMGDMML